MTQARKPVLLATVFSDYICPFCYVGDVRLDRLRDEYELRVNWCFLEIHPDTPEQGMPLERLGYEPEVRQRMMDNLARMAEENGLPLMDRDFTTNSHRALLLAEAAKAAGAETFYRLHRRLFEAYFGEARNIGEEAVLRELARETGVPEAVVESAWSDPAFEQRLLQNLRAATELGVRATPTFYIGAERIDGAVAEAELRSAARRSVQADG